MDAKDAKWAASVQKSLVVAKAQEDIGVLGRDTQTATIHIHISFTITNLASYYLPTECESREPDIL